VPSEITPYDDSGAYPSRMRVRCVSLDYTAGSRSFRAGSWLTIGQEYVVLEIKASDAQGVSLRVMTDEADAGGGLYPITPFEITDPRPSPRWRIAADGYGGMTVGPPEWQVPGFWPLLYGDVPFILGHPDMSAHASFSLQTQALLDEDAEAAQAQSSDIAEP